MIDRSEFYQRAAPVMALYAEGRYLDALDVTSQLAQQFPDEAPTTSFWQLCLLSRAGKLDEALSLMSDALARGLWWSEAQLREEEDLAPLHGLPAYEDMVAECASRHVVAQKDSRPELFVRLPPARPPYPLLIALHGKRGSPGRDLARWEPAVQMGWMLAMPQSSQLSSPNSFHWDDAALARDEIGSAYRRLLDEYEIDTRRVVIGGFSQGGALSVQISARGIVPARGFIAVVPGESALVNLEELARSAQGLRGYVVAGGRDPHYEVFTHIQALLGQHGVPCEIETHLNLAHEFPPDFGRSLDKALKFLFA